MGISNLEIKKLYGSAAGRCSICEINVFENHVHIGEMAHIIAKSENGARGYEELAGGRDSYDNLILLCANHHLEVDRNPSVYTTSKLREIKANHERKVSLNFKYPKERDNDLIFLKAFMEFVPFTKLAQYVEYLPASVKLDFHIVGTAFEDICKSKPHLYPLNDQDLQAKFGSFKSAHDDLWCTIDRCTNVNGRWLLRFGPADDYRFIHMERGSLPRDETIRLCDELERKKSTFLVAYENLIKFIRSNYSEVDLDSYRPYKI